MGLAWLVLAKQLSFDCVGVGGPAFNVGGQVVGIAFQSMAGSDAENIGYIIPTDVILHFLTDYQ